MKKTYINLSYACDEIKELFLNLLHSDNLRASCYQLEQNGHDFYIASHEVLYFLVDLAYEFTVLLNREDNEYYGHVDNSIDEMLDVTLFAKKEQ